MNNENHLCLIIAYNGANYCGFQLQPGKDTVQARLEEALLRVTGEPIKIRGSGRTDAGVHARAQFADFYTGANIPLDRWRLALNSCLPEDVVVRQALEVPANFHARKSAHAKTYRYTVNFGRVPDLFHAHMQYHFPRKFNLDLIRSASEYFLGEHDFTSFAATRSIRRTNVRKITEIRVESSNSVYESNCEIVQFFITGTGFLQHMVRIIVGTLLEVGIGKKREQDIEKIMLARNRLLAGPTAPSHGLMLWDVFYPDTFGLNLENFRKL
jgi:tRNA pseudouridine38-40 synthase